MNPGYCGNSTAYGMMVHDTYSFLEKLGSALQSIANAQFFSLACFLSSLFFRDVLERGYSPAAVLFSLVSVYHKEPFASRT